MKNGTGTIADRIKGFQAEFASITSEHEKDQAAITKAVEEFRRRQAQRQARVTHIEGAISALTELLPKEKKK